MRIALDHTSEIGVRAGRLLLGEPDLEFLGIVRRPVKDADARLKRVSNVSGFDAVVTDDPDSAIFAEAAAADTPCVLWADAPPPGDEYGGSPVLLGANLLTGIGRSLAEREFANAGSGAEVLFAWTEPGKPLRSGEPVSFPEPVGARWGSRRVLASRRLDVTAPVDDEWAGVLVRTTTNTTSRTLGIADLATHLEAIALAAGAVAAATGNVAAGFHQPEALANEYLDAALRIGLDIASFTSGD